MDKVEVEWIDSKSGPNGWEYLDDLSQLHPVTCHTVGFFIGKWQGI